MCIICKGENLKGLRTLDCSYCRSLTNIPVIKGLKTLNCSNCPLLTNIPIIEGLQILNCSNCRLLIFIPIFFSTIGYLILTRCVWMKVNSNPNYADNIKKLTKIQIWSKRMLLRKRLLKLIQQLMPIYYHPDAAGYYHKKEMSKFIMEFAQLRDAI